MEGEAGISVWRRNWRQEKKDKRIRGNISRGRKSVGKRRNRRKVSEGGEKRQSKDVDENEKIREKMKTDIGKERLVTNHTKK